MKAYDGNLPYDDEEIIDGEVADFEENFDNVVLDGVADDTYDEIDDLADFDDLSMGEEKINRVLDELAELKRNMSPSGGNAYGGYTRHANGAPGDVALYNEINRLRDELSRMQHSQSLHMELTKMKEEMEKESKQNEAKLLSEIREMKGNKPAQAKQSELDDSADDGLTAKQYEKLESELVNIKSSLPDVALLKEVSAKLSEVMSVIGSVSAPVEKASGLSDNVEVLRRLVEIKLTLGKLPLSEYEKELKILSLYDELIEAKSAVYSSVCGMTEKLDKMRKLETDLSSTDDCYVADVVDGYNSLVDYLLNKPLTIDGVEVFSKLPTSGKIKSSLRGEKLTLAVEFINASMLAKDKKISGAVDKLVNIVSLKNNLQSGRKATENDALYNEIIRLSSDLVFLTDEAEVRNCSKQMAEKLEELCYLPYSEFVTYPKIAYDKAGVTVTRSVVRDFIEEISTSEEIKTDDETVKALTNAVNLLRAEIANGALNAMPTSCATGNDVRTLMEYNEDARVDRERLIADVQHIKYAIDSLVGEDIGEEGESDEINKLLEEVKTLNTEMNNLNETAPETVSVSTPDEVNLFLSEIISLRDEVQSYKDEITAVIDKLSGGSSDIASGGDTNAIILDELTAIRADLALYVEELGVKAVTQQNSEAVLSEEKPAEEPAQSAPKATVLGEDDYIEAFMQELAEIKNIISQTPDNELDAKLLAVRDELLGALEKKGESLSNEKLEEISGALASISQQISDVQIYATVAKQSEESAENAEKPAVAVADNSGLIEEIRALRASIAEKPTDSSKEISALRDEISSLKSELASIKGVVAMPVAVDNSQSETMLAEIYENVRMMREEPDYGVMNEVLALREEFQAMKEKLEKSEADSSKESILGEIKSLRDQIFAINMATVSDGEQQTYESYNNIIIDELSAVREELASLLSIGTDGITVDTSTITAKLDEVKELMSEAREAADAHKKATEADEIVQLKQTIAQQKETQAVMLDLMNKMVAKLDKQVEDSAKISEKIGKLGEIETESASEEREKVRNEIENIKYTLGVIQGNEDKDADADLEESIGKLKAELSQLAGIMGDGEKSKKKSSSKKK
ncbi:MAG: hypothetical protein IJX05_02830 [Clostridia bacterium]|nr:hypothetical protein [Clostridia bacterium]